MKVLLWVYIALWGLTVGPLWLFNIRKFRRRTPGEKAKANVKVISTVVVVSLLLSGLWSGLFLDSKNTRYEITAEAVFSAQADYIKGKTDRAGLEAALQKYKKDGFDVGGIAALLDEKKGAKEVRFQISDRINATTYEKESLGFPDTKKIDRENPMYIMCKMEIDGKNSFYIVRFEQDEHMRWRMDYEQPASQQQIKGIAMPSQEYGVWYH